MSVLWFVLIGIAAGWLAAGLMKTGPQGLLGNLVIGCVGAVVGGYFFRILGIGRGGLIGELVSATVGAMLFIGIVRFARKRIR